jgi:hypothetical protein
VEIVGGIIALLKAIPILDQWFGNLAIAYNKWKVESHDKAFAEGMRSLIGEYDQRKLEDAAGMNPGANPDQTEIITRPRRPNA